MGYDITLFWGPLLLGAFAGGQAFLKTILPIAEYRAASSIFRWNYRMLFWSVVAFCGYPVYAFLIGLPFSFFRAAASFVVSLIIPMFFFLGFQHRKNPEQYRSFLFGSLVSGLAYLGALIYTVWSANLLWSMNFIDIRIMLYATFPTWPSRYPLILIMLGFLALAFRSERVERGYRMMGTIALICLGGALYSLTRAAGAGILLALFVLWVFRLRGRMMGLLLLVVLGVYAQGTDLAYRFTLFKVEGRIESSSAIRLAIWEKSLMAVLRSPVFGYGLQGTGMVLGEVETDLDLVDATAAHNDFVDTAVRTGVPGLVCFMGLVFSLFWHGWRYAQKKPGGHPSAYIVTGMMGAVGYGMFHELTRLPIGGSLFWYLSGVLAQEQVREEKLEGPS